MNRAVDVIAVLAIAPAAWVAARGTDLLAVACAGVVFIAAVLLLCRHGHEEERHR